MLQRSILSAVGIGAVFLASATAGQSVSGAGGEANGTAILAEPTPGFAVTNVTCDDQNSATPSSGDAQSRVASFHIDDGESVTCTFTIAAARRESSTTAPGTTTPGSAAPGSGGTNPFQDPDKGFTDFPMPDDLPPAAGSFPVPKAGPWDVTNFTGRMACGTFINKNLKPSRESGVLEVLDGGGTIIGTGLSEGTAPITMHAVAGITGRYAGNVGGTQDGIPMTIEFFWQLITDEWISGYLTSQVSQQGMTCNMFRPFELKYSGT